MKVGVIKLKVVLATIVCLAIGGLGVIGLLETSYTRSVRMISETALEQARSTFAAMQETEVAKMSVASELVMANADLRGLFEKRDRGGLVEATLPLFERLKTAYGITILNYLDAEERRFVTMTTPHDTKLIGAKAVRFNVQEAARTKTWSNGLALGFFGFALRVTHPFYDDGHLAGGRLLGYLEMGSEIGGFLGNLKAQTGREYGLVIRKQYLNAEQWAGQRKLLGLANNWDEQGDIVVANQTTSDERMLKFAGDITTLPDTGLALDVSDARGSVFTRSVFPIRDGAGVKVGAVFVLVDITPMYTQLHRVRQYAVGAVVGLALLLSAGLIWALSRLVFRRLDEIRQIATRLVGGDYETPVTVTHEDEIGDFEKLFEQLRTVFVNLLHEYETLAHKSEGTNTDSGTSARAPDRAPSGTYS